MSNFGVLSRRAATYGAVSVLAVLAAGCEEMLPVAIGDGDLLGELVTVAIEIPWSSFASNLQVFGGYGSADDLGSGVIANLFAGELNAHTLLRFAAFPFEVTATDATGTNRPTFDFTYAGGRFAALMDTVGSTNTGPVTLRLSATTTEWDLTTTSWNYAVDTINDRRLWPEAGGGPVVEVATAVWDPATGDSVIFDVDSVFIAAWADTSDLSAGGRLESLDPGPRLRIRGGTLRLDARPAINPDTLIETTAFLQDVTFIYDPFPLPPPDGVRIGGTPSWRTVLDIEIPETIDGPPEFCAVVSCPHALTAGEISYAALVLTSRASPPAFQPSDSIFLDVRPVFRRAAMPKSPLGASLILSPFGRGVEPQAFGLLPGKVIEIPFTAYARALVEGVDRSGAVPPKTLALLSVVEPFSVSFASFEGPGSPFEPILKLVLTIGPSVELP